MLERRGRMTDAKEPCEGGDDSRSVQLAAYLWEEYRYRHDLVWQLVFRVTAVATILLITPFIAGESVREALDYWWLFLPALAVAVILIGYFVLQSELDLLERVRKAYRLAQNEALAHLEPHWTPHLVEGGQARSDLRWWEKLARFRSGHFAERVSTFLLLILFASIAFFFLFLFAWLPDIT
jgi:hypothetical protein